MDYGGEIQKFLKDLVDYKEGRVPQQEEPDHSTILDLANDLDEAARIYELNLRARDGDTVGFVSLEEAIKSLGLDEK